jgi:hypothetical protein
MQPIPKFIKLGGYEIQYKDCNDFQKPIYEMLVIYTHKLGSSTVDITAVTEEQKEFLRTAGVVKFLRSRLDEYGDVTKVPRDLYDLEAQMKTLLEEDTVIW